MKNLTLIFCLTFLVNHIAAQTTDTLVIATYTYATNNRIANLQPFAEQLSQEMQTPTIVKSFATVRDLIAAIKTESVDIVFINTFGYLLLAADDAPAAFTPVAALNVKKGTADNYKTILLAAQGSPVHHLNELQDKAGDLTMMFVAEGSTSGNLVPRMLLSSLNIKEPENQFKQVLYGKTHANTIAEVLAGSTDLAAMGSDEYFKLINQTPDAKDRLNVLWISEEIPLGPVMIKNNLSKKHRKQIRRALLTLHKANPDALQSIKAGWSEARQSEQFIPVTDTHYNTFRNLTGNTQDLLHILNKFMK